MMKIKLTDGVFSSLGMPAFPFFIPTDLIKAVNIEIIKPEP